MLVGVEDFAAAGRQPYDTAIDVLAAWMIDDLGEEGLQGWIETHDKGVMRRPAGRCVFVA